MTKATMAIRAMIPAMRPDKRPIVLAVAWFVAAKACMSEVKAPMAQ